MRILFLTFALLLIPVAQYAQTDLAVSADIQLKLYPPFPRPHETVRVEAQSFSFNAVTAPFTWYVNGTQVSSGKGNTSITVTMGAAGSRTTIRVTASPPNDRTYDKTLVLYAGDVDLLWSANTYTPPGYHGKALPTPGATVRIVALPNLAIDGVRLSAKNLVYEWSANNAPITSASGIGKDELLLSMGTSPGIEQRVKVRVSDTGERAVQEKIISIMTRSPRLQFYELDPLRGPVYRTALAGGTANARSGSEMRFLAVPFFIANDSLPLLTYSWRVGNERLPAGSTPEILLYRAQGGSAARQLVSLEILNPSYIFENARASFTIDVK